MTNMLPCFMSEFLQKDFEYCNLDEAPCLLEMSKCLIHLFQAVHQTQTTEVY
jgi:hypothetical protein